MLEGRAAVPVSLRIPADLLAALDKVAAALDRPRSWVMLRALRQYVLDEGAEVLDVEEGIAEADRGEVLAFDDVIAEMEDVIGKAEAKRRAG